MASGESNTSKAIKGMSSQMVVTIALAVVELVSFSIMSRLLSKADFGYYAAIAAVTAIFASFSEAGIGAAVVQRKEMDRNYVDNAFTLSILFGSFMAFLLVALSSPLSKVILKQEVLRVPLMLMAVTLLANSTASVSLGLLQRERKFLQIGAINLISLVVTTAVAVVLALKGYGFYAIVAKALLTSLLTLFLSYLSVRRKFRFALDKDAFGSIFSFSGWLMVSVFFRNLSSYVDRLLLPRLLGIEATGLYNRPKEFINQASSKIGGIYDTALFPVLSGVQDETASMQNAYRKSLYYLNLFAVTVCAGFVLNGDLLIRIFFGEKWVESVSAVFVIFSVALIFNFNARLLDCFFRSKGYTRQQFRYRLLELAVKFGSLFIGYRWGVVGVAVSLTFTNFLLAALKMGFISRKIDIPVGESLSVVLSGYRPLLIYLPLVICLAVFPRTLAAELLMLAAYVALSVLMFLVCPSLVGGKYCNDAYPKAKSYIMKKLGGR